jgi:predicted ABC-type ATPase
MTVLPETFHVREFVNADEIARGLSPLNPEGMAIEAGKVMLKRIEQLVQANENFAIETTLSSKNCIRLIKECRANGHYIDIFLFECLGLGSS